MKTAFRLVLAVACLAVVIVASVAQAQFNYTTHDGTITITGYTGLSPVVIIPDTINGFPVTTLGVGAFHDCTNVTSVNISKNVTTWMTTKRSIEMGPFWPCVNLTEITVDPLNKSFSSVAGVFFTKNQTGLLQFPRGRSGEYAVPAFVTFIGMAAFADCGGLTGIAISDTVAWIGRAAFRGCTDLAEIVIPDSVGWIGGSAFGSCISLTGVYFQGNAPGIEAPPVGGGEFGGTTNATVYYLPGTTGWSTYYSGRPTALWIRPNPVILHNSIGIQTNAFGFRISWATNRSVAVEASTSLSNPNWSPVSTNTLTDGWCDYRDPEWAKYAGRFYRVRQQ